MSVPYSKALAAGCLVVALVALGVAGVAGTVAPFRFAALWVAAISLLVRCHRWKQGQRDRCLAARLHRKEDERGGLADSSA